ncbi:hypothetical protein [Streptomyces sp. NPDC051561]|uniref:hypothetical protein n=1 Tax=Streptomyces sp. NPDC051561 TaxID=3365658 RepID=UPI003787DCC4
MSGTSGGGHGSDRDGRDEQGGRGERDGLSERDGCDGRGEGFERQRRYGPDGPRNDRTGNGIVNDGCNGREERHGRGNPPNGSGFGHGSGGSALRSGSGSGPGSGSAFGSGPAFGPGSGSRGNSTPGSPFGTDTPALSPDELVIRRLMHGAVEDLIPSDHALDHLRRAVPARRARRRQAVVGVAAAVLLIGTAVPAFLHVSQTRDTAAAHPANAGHAEDPQGTDGDPAGTGTGTDGGGTDGSPDGKTPDRTTPGKDPEDKQEESEAGSPDAGRTGAGDQEIPGEGAYEQDASEPDRPACDGSQLKVVQATTGNPDGKGRVYGTFRIANKSGSECAVPGEGQMNFEALGAAQPGRIKVVDHKSGDPAEGLLPDPSKEARSLVLPPSAAYEVKFAWVPEANCPTTGPSPDPTSTTGAGDTSGQVTGGTPGGEGAGKVPEPPGEDSDTTKMAPQLGTAEGDPADGKVAVTHTAEPGAPEAAATIPNACAGTIYRTGVLDAP